MTLNQMILPIFLPKTKGECLRYFRNYLDLTQSGLSKLCGVERSAISKMENGDTPVNMNTWMYVTKKLYEILQLDQQEVSYNEFIKYIDSLYEEYEKAGVML